MMGDKKTVILRGPGLTLSGYGVLTRQVARWLFDLQDERNDLDIVCEPLIWGHTPWITDVSRNNGLIGRIVQSSQNRPSYDVSIQNQLPSEWNPFLANYNIGMTAAVETDRCNPEWIEHVNKMDMVIVPSEFTKQTLLNSGNITARLEVVPESFPDCFLEETKPLNLELETDFNFLVFGQFTGNNPENDRKNLFYTLKWLCETFKDNPNVGVVVKTNMARNTVLDRINTSTILGQLIMEVRKTAYPKIYLVHGDMEEEEVAGLYKHPTVKALVNLSHGEGFGLSSLEAAACGVPVIATNWSAPTEFLGLGKFIKVDYNLVPVHESRVDNQIFMKDTKWAQPVEEDAKRKLRKFVENPTIPTEWAKELQKKIQENYSFEKIKTYYSDITKGII